MGKIRILWTDDEIEVHEIILFSLRKKGYDIDTCSNRNDTIDLVRQNSYDIIFLMKTCSLGGIET